MENRKSEKSSLIDLSEIALNKKNKNLNSIEIPFKNSDIRISDIMSRIAALEDRLSDASTVIDLSSKHPEKQKVSQITDAVATTKHQDTSVLDAEKKNTSLEQHISEASTLINLLDNVVRQKDNYISNIKSSIQEKESLLSSLSSNIHQKDLDIAHLQDSIKSQNEQLSVIDMTVQNKSRHIEDLEMNAQQRESRISQLENTLVQKDSAISSLRHTENKNNDHIYTLEYSARQKDARIADLDNTVVLKDGHISQLETSAKQKDARIADLDNTVVLKDSHISQLETSTKQKDAHIADLDNTVVLKDNHISQLETSAKQKDARIADLDNTVVLKDDHISQLETSAKQKDARISDLDNTVVLKDDHISQLETSAKQKDARIADLDNTVVLKDDHISQLETTTKKKDVRITDLNNTVVLKDGLISQLETSTKQKDARIESLCAITGKKDARILELEDSLKQHLDQLSTLKSVLKQKNAYVKTLENDALHKTDYITSLEIDLKERDNFISLLEETIRDNHIQFRELQRHTDHQDRQIANLKKTTKKSKRLINNLLRSLRQKDARISDFIKAEQHNKNEIHNFQKTVRQKDTRISSLTGTLHCSEDRIYNLEYTVRQRDTKVTDLKDMLQKKSHDISSLKSALHEKDSQMSEMENRIIQNENHITHLEDRVNRREEYAANLEYKIDSHHSSLALIHDSYGWKVLTSYYRVRDKLLPANTWRRSLYRFSFEAMQDPRVLIRRGMFSRIKSYKNELYYTCDYPLRLEKNFSTYVSVSGWALSPNGIDRVEIYSDNQFLMNASYGRLRPDVQKAFPQIKDSDQSGFYCLLNGLESGPHELTLKIIAKDGKTGTITRSVHITDSVNTVKVPKIPIMELNDDPIEPLDNSFVSVIIPTLNAGSDFITLLPALSRQQGINKIEIIIVDSGSTDDTLDLAKANGAKTVIIPPEEFSHSHARNLGASHATGTYLLFMTQDALPPSDQWLYEMLSAVQNNGAAAVSCAETPRENADLFYRVISSYHYRFLEVDKHDKISSLPEETDYASLRKNGQLSDIACLIKHDIYKDYKFRGDYAEDLDMGIRLIKDGYKIGFLGSVRIIHSHDRSSYYHLKRAYVDTLSLPKMFDDFTYPPVSNVKEFMRDILFTYSVTNSLIQSDLTKVKIPCSVDTFTNILRNKFKTDIAYKKFALVDMTDNSYIDEEFHAFLRRISAQYSLNGKKSYDGFLIPAMLGFVDIASEYISNTYELIDEHVIEDFKCCMYKAFAYQTGAHLSFCYLNNPSNRDILKSLNDELRSGI